MNTNTKFHSTIKQQGLAAIELTLVLPFLLLILFATAEFGRLLYQYSALNHLTRDALRYAVTNITDGSTGLVTEETVAGMATSAEQILKYGAEVQGAEILPNLSSAIVTLSKQGTEFVTLTVTYHWQPVFGNSLNTFTSAQTIDLSFPIVVNYTMRAL